MNTPQLLVTWVMTADGRMLEDGFYADLDAATAAGTAAMQRGAIAAVVTGENINLRRNPVL